MSFWAVHMQTAAWKSIPWMGKSFTSGGFSLISMVMTSCLITRIPSAAAWTRAKLPSGQLRSCEQLQVGTLEACVHEHSRAFTSIEIFISCGTLPNTCFITRLSKDPEEARFFKRGNSAPLTATEQHLGLKSSHGTSKSFDINNLSTTMWNSLTNKNNIKRLSKMF